MMLKLVVKYWLTMVNLGLRVVEKDDATREFVVEVENDDGVIAKQKV